MMDPMATDTTFQMLRHSLEVTSRRHAILSANLANLDTPGYQARDLDFHAVMREVEAQLETGRHFPREQQDLSSRVFLDDGVHEREGVLVQRVDGNNVDLDRELGDLSSNRGRHRLATQLISKKFRLFDEIIRNTK